MTICHRPVGGPPITLELPIPAAEAHLANHPLDTIGACPTLTVEPEVTETEIAEPEVPVEEVIEPVVEEVPVEEEPIPPEEEPVATEV